jgi:hypothetical protein
VLGLGLGALLVAACAGAPATTIPPVTLPTIPPITLPTIPPITLPSLPIIEIPSFEIPSFAIPSFATDPVLEAAFPAEIDGQPVRNVRATNFLAVMTGLGADREDIGRFVTGMQGLGVDPTAVGFGSATANVFGSPISFQVLRFPGFNAASALTVIAGLDDSAPVPTFTTETMGGKSVTVSTSDEGVQYYYFNGELAWFLPSAEPEEAAVIIAALP